MLIRPRSSRYERVRKVQKTGETTRDLWHKTDWAKVRENPSSIAFPREDWIHGFDAEKYAEDNFADAFKAQTEGAAPKAETPLGMTANASPAVVA